MAAGLRPPARTVGPSFCTGRLPTVPVAGVAATRREGGDGAAPLGSVSLMRSHWRRVCPPQGHLPSAQGGGDDAAEEQCPRTVMWPSRPGGRLPKQLGGRGGGAVTCVTSVLHRAGTAARSPAGPSRGVTSSAAAPGARGSSPFRFFQIPTGHTRTKVPPGGLRPPGPAGGPCWTVAPRGDSARAQPRGLPGPWVPAGALRDGGGGRSGKPPPGAPAGLGCLGRPAWRPGPGRSLPK